MLAVEAEGLSHRFGARWVLRRVDLALPQGAACLLTGPNGAGKTTLLRVLATALAPTRGDLKLFGAPVFDLSVARRRIALMTHASHLYEDLSGAQNLAFAADLLGRPADGVPQALSDVGLAGAGDRPVRTYSAGMRRRLGLARFLLQRPALGLLDEPFGQLDKEGVALVLGTLDRLRREGVTLVISTHTPELCGALCDVALSLPGGAS